MSTKISLVWGERFHVYQEIFDEDNVHFRFDGNPSVRLKLDLEQVGGICACFNLDSLYRQADLTDDQITEHVRSEVRARLSLSSGDVGRICGMLVYGDAEDPEEEQVARGFKHYTAKRDEIRRWADAIRSKRAQPFMFGLESLM